MKQLAQDHGFQWWETGEHSLCDAELISRQGWRYGLTSVTEYHEGLKRLTRFAFGPAPRHLSIGGTLFAMFSGALLSYGWNLPSMGSALMLVGIIACTILFAKNIKAKYQIRSLLKASAVLAGISQNFTTPPISTETLPSPATSLHKP